MNAQERQSILQNFIKHVDKNEFSSKNILNDETIIKDLNISNLPSIDTADQLMTYHDQIKKQIDITYKQVKDIMSHMKQLKNRKINLQKLIDCMTSLNQIKRISYDIGREPKTIIANLQIFYQIKNKVFYVNKYIQRIQKQIDDLQKQYQENFNIQINKQNSKNISEVSKILQIINSNSSCSVEKTDSLSQIKKYCLENSKKQLKDIEKDLFSIPLIGNGQCNYLFFDLAKTALKLMVSFINNFKNNILKISGQSGLRQVLQQMFKLTIFGIIYEILLRVIRYYQIDKITIQRQKYKIKQKQYKLLVPYLKQYVAIWNQLQRFKIYLISLFTENQSKDILKMKLEDILNQSKMIQNNSKNMIFIQIMQRYKLDRLLKTSNFINSICSIDQQFFKKINSKNIRDNQFAHQFLQQMLNSIIQGIQKSFQTLNLIIISATINFINHNLIYQDVSYAFRAVFQRVFNKLNNQSKNINVLNASMIVLNTVAALPKALNFHLTKLKLPQQIDNTRIKAQIQTLITNNTQKCMHTIDEFFYKIANSQWFQNSLIKDYQSTIKRWQNLENEIFNSFIKIICKIHVQLILQTEFNKKYTQILAISYEKQIRKIIAFYEQFTHPIIPIFKKILDYLQILQLQNQQDFKIFMKEFSKQQVQKLKHIWNLRS